MQRSRAEACPAEEARAAPNIGVTRDRKRLARLRSSYAAERPTAQRLACEAPLAAEERKLIRIGGNEDIAPVKTQGPIIKLSPALDLTVGELACESAFWFRIVVNPAGLSEHLRIRVADRDCQIALTLGS